MSESVSETPEMNEVLEVETRAAHLHNVIGPDAQCAVASAIQRFISSRWNAGGEGRAQIENVLAEYRAAKEAPAGPDGSASA